MRPLFGLHVALIFIINGSFVSSVSDGPSHFAANAQNEESLKYIRRKRNSFTNSAPEFTSHFIIQPKVYHVREKREVDVQNVSPKRDKRNGTIVENINDLMVSFKSEGQEYVVDLQLNHQLIPRGYFQKYHKEVGFKTFK